MLMFTRDCTISNTLGLAVSRSASMLLGLNVRLLGWVSPTSS